ncbi:protein containing Cpl-7 lysozyme, partial [gut metagenome]
MIRGDWGNGADRKARLESAGYNYDAVQARVNAILGGGN